MGIIVSFGYKSIQFQPQFIKDAKTISSVTCWCHTNLPTVKPINARHLKAQVCGDSSSCISKYDRFCLPWCCLVVKKPNWTEGVWTNQQWTLHRDFVVFVVGVLINLPIDVSICTVREGRKPFGHKSNLADKSYCCT